MQAGQRLTKILDTARRKWYNGTMLENNIDLAEQKYPMRFYVVEERIVVKRTHLVKASSLEDAKTKASQYHHDSQIVGSSDDELETLDFKSRELTDKERSDPMYNRACIGICEQYDEHGEYITPKVEKGPRKKGRRKKRKPKTSGFVNHVKQKTETKDEIEEIKGMLWES